MVEELADANDWTTDRRADDEMVIEITGQWATYGVFLSWSDDVGALHLSMGLDVRVPTRRRQAVCELLAVLNERLWLGHFALWSEKATPMFRYSLLARGGIPLSREHIEDVIRVAFNECERYYPAFQFVIWGGRSPADAMASALLDVAGEA